MNQKITVIIPILSEFDEVKGILRLLEQQTLLPSEVIFIRSDISNAAFLGESDKFKVKVIENSSGRVRLPGESRNIAIDLLEESSLAAFLDMGTKPERNWLMLQCGKLRESGHKGILGKCRFFGEGIFGLITCALSSGIGGEASTLPGSVIEAALCKEVGRFRSTLRAGEDLLWKENLMATKHVLPTGSGIIIYDSFSNKPVSILKKWFIYSRNLVQSGMGDRQIVMYLAFGILMLAAFLQAYVIEFFIFYFSLRGFFYPAYKSRNLFWFKSEPLSLMLCPPFAFCLDISKMFGLLSESVCVLARRTLGANKVLS